MTAHRPVWAGSRVALWLERPIKVIQSLYIIYIVAHSYRWRLTPMLHRISPRKPAKTSVVRPALRVNAVL